MSRGPDALPDIRHRLPAQYDAVPDNRDGLPAAGNDLPECGHHLPRSGDCVSADHDPMYERGHCLPRARHRVSGQRHPMPAAGDGVRSAGAGPDLHHHRLSIVGHQSGHRGRASLCGDRRGMPATNGEHRPKLKTLRADAMNQAQWYNPGRPINIGRPFNLVSGRELW